MIAAAGIGVRLDEERRVERRAISERADGLGRSKRHRDNPRSADAAAKRVGKVVPGADRNGRSRSEAGELRTAPGEPPGDRAFVLQRGECGTLDAERVEQRVVPVPR